MSYVAVIGAGSWGTALAVLLSRKDYDVSLWVYEPELAAQMSHSRVNTWYLPEAVLPPTVAITADLKEALCRSRYVLSVVPTQHVRAVFSQALPHIPSGALLVSASKGIEQKSLKTPSQVLKELVGREVAVLSGPSFAKEVQRGLPTAVTLAYPHRAEALLLQELFSTEHFRVYIHDDVLGVELGGALKNIIAIAAGISDGLGLGHNARAALITRGLAECTRLGVALGAKAQTFSGLSGLGDLVLTCTSSLSRNYRFGFSLGKGKSPQDVLKEIQGVAEGIHTAEAAYQQALAHGVEMPITEQVCRILKGETSPYQALHALMSRVPREEFYG
jgi:glycerol-3-phosphate dehydrogenase (NAD(P)+)